MTCPRCSQPLEQTRLHELGVVYNAHTCRACEGLWVGPQQMSEISAKVDQRVFEIRRIPDAAEQQVPLSCPACPSSVIMTKVVSSRDANVVMDVCPTCRHVWLDRGERAAI